MGVWYVVFLSVLAIISSSFVNKGKDKVFYVLIVLALTPSLLPKDFDSKIAKMFKEISKERKQESSSSSKKSNKVKENHEIPGFSSCLQNDTWSDDPNENISYCCKKVRGKLRDGIMMKTCEK